jgi:hypothetical protein
MSKAQGGIALMYNGGTTPQTGGSFGSFMKKANKFLKDNKVISKVAGVASDLGVPKADVIGKYAGKMGYGKKRSHKKK